MPGIRHYPANPLIGAAFTGPLSLYGFGLPPVFSRTRPPIHRDATTTYDLQTGHGWSTNGTGVASATLNDTTADNFIRGTQSVRVTTDGSGIQAAVRKTGLSAIDLTGKMLRVTFKVDDATHLDHIYFYAGTSSFANYISWTVHTRSSTSANYVQSGEWVTVNLAWADIASRAGTYTITNGVPSSKTGFTDFQFAVYDDASAAVTYHLQSVEIVPDSSTTFPSGVVSVTFDDSYVSQWDYGRPKLDSYGYRATTYNIADAIGSSGIYYTLAQLKSLQNYSGWEAAGHAYSSALHNATGAYSVATSAQVHADFQKLRLWQIQNGFNSDNFSYPQGHFDLTSDLESITSIAAQYWATARTIVSETKETWPPANPNRIKALTGISEFTGGTTPTVVTSAGGVLDRCLAQSSWLILCFHKIVTGSATATTECTQTGFNAVIDGINSRGIPVLPVQDVIRYYT